MRPVVALALALLLAIAGCKTTAKDTPEVPVPEGAAGEFVTRATSLSPALGESARELVGIDDDAEREQRLSRQVHAEQLAIQELLEQAAGGDAAALVSADDRRTALDGYRRAYQAYLATR